MEALRWDNLQEWGDLESRAGFTVGRCQGLGSRRPLQAPCQLASVKGEACLVSDSTHHFTFLCPPEANDAETSTFTSE